MVCTQTPYIYCNAQELWGAPQKVDNICSQMYVGFFPTKSYDKFSACCYESLLSHFTDWVGSYLLQGSFGICFIQINTTAYGVTKIIYFYYALQCMLLFQFVLMLTLNGTFPSQS